MAEAHTLMQGYIRRLLRWWWIAFKCDCDGYHACDYHYSMELRERITRI
jgi:hypothetical protein